MEQVEAQKSVSDLLPPPYLLRMGVRRKTWAWASVVFLLLAVIVVGGTLLGVYMAQKHTEAVVELAFQSASGEKVQQTVIVNDKQNVAAFHVNIDNTSTTILYDYNKGLVGFRRLGEIECYVMRMKDTKAPTMKDVLNSMNDSPGQNSTISKIIYNIQTENVKADRTKLGLYINLLCSDQPIYWGLLEGLQKRCFMFCFSFG
ncbi:surfactant protein C-like [Gastrophryne carolinensis]